MSATFAQVQESLGSDANKVRMVSVSIDPEHDTPERLREYAKRFDAGPQWHFLTGRLDDSIAVQKAFGVYRGNKMNHEPTTLLKAADGETWFRMDGLASAADVVAEYRRLSAH
jgi:protein SCO1/2